MCSKNLLSSLEQRQKTIHYSSLTKHTSQSKVALPSYEVTDVTLCWLNSAAALIFVHWWLFSIKHISFTFGFLIGFCTLHSSQRLSVIRSLVATAVLKTRHFSRRLSLANVMNVIQSKLHIISNSVALWVNILKPEICLHCTEYPKRCFTHITGKHYIIYNQRFVCIHSLSKARFRTCYV